MSSLLKTASSAAESAGKLLSRGLSLIDAGGRDARLATCEQCDSLNKLTWMCGECNCFVKIKSWSKVLDCPLNKWPKIELPVIANPAGDTSKPASPAGPQETPPKRRKGCCG